MVAYALLREIIKLRKSTELSTIQEVSGWLEDGLHDGATADTVDGRPPIIPGDQRSRSRGVAIGVGTGTESNFLGGSTSSLRMSRSSVTPTESEDGLRELPEAASTVKVELMTQAAALDERLETFWNQLTQGQLTLEQQEQTLDLIKGDHDKLRRTYLQAKDDYNVLRRSGVVDKDAINFDQNKELEGQLFRLGMRFDEVHETVESNLKDRPAQRQPFQTDDNNNATNTNNKNNRAQENRGNGESTDAVIKTRPLSHTSSLDATEEAAFERRVNGLRQEYNENMDAYRKLKYTADSSPEGEREIEAVVKRLNEICTEMPDMFRLSPEIEARCDKMKVDGKLNFIERKNSVWEKLNRREQEAKVQRQSPVPPSPRTRNSRPSPVDGRPPSILRQTSDASDVDSIRARLDGSRSSLGSILPDRMDRPPSRGHAHSSQQDRPSSRASNRSGRGSSVGFAPDRPSSVSPRDSRQSPTPSLPRPRRHAHELKDPKLAKMPDMRLPNSGSGASDNESRRRGSSSPAGAVGGLDTEGALAALPGPGKFKQMTKQRGADDADSGFLGSMVGSGVGVPPLLPSSQHSLDQQAEEEGERERTLRLRQRADESSTITDNSMDASSQVERRLSARRRDATQDSLQQEGSRASQRHRREESYDGEEDTMEALDSEPSAMRQRGGGARRRGHRDSSREISLDATLEEDGSMESDVSTPRAVKQAPTPPPSAKRRSSGQQASTSEEASSPDKPRRPSSRAQTASETEEELRAINNSKIRRSGQRLSREEERERAAEREEKETVHRTRLKSPPPPPRPSSRGSPTTDLYHTRGRHSSGESRRSATGSRRGGHRETSRDERQEEGQVRAEIRQTHQGPRIDRPSSRQGQQERQQQQQPPQHQQQRQQRHQQQHQNSYSAGLPPGLAPASDLARRVKDYEERSAGSSDVEVGSSVTRASSVNSSNRLKALQEEIEKLKEGVARANEKASRPSPQYPQAPPTYIHTQSQQTGPASAPAPAAPPANQSQDQQDYYDPFDDPYGFMRMPRRRANSFSGGRERDWGEWYWNLPQNRQYDGGDIPLGYAAADAYAENIPQRRDGRERNTRESVKERMRQRRQERKQKEEDQAEALVNGGPQTGPPMAGQTGHDPQTQALYDYYVPPSRYSARGMRSQLAARGYFTTPTGAKIYSSTGEDGDVEGEGQEENGEEQGLKQHWFGFQQGAGAQARPWYQIRRASRPLTSPNGAFGPQFYPGSRLTQSQEDVRLTPQYYGGYSTQQTASATCPMCGSTSSHTHANYTHVGHPQAATHPQQPRSARNTSPVRGRSRSTGRSHSYSRYKVREYTSLSDSDDEKIRHRSRSLSRGRSRPKSRSKHRNSRHYSSDSLSDQSVDERETGLDRSLSLSQDISRLTKKMLGTLKGELRKSKSKQREFGSSYW
ncbi:At-hook-containing transcription factor [Plakobranchus ocellatus]|uniref:At-hook-containing transcription factor n=1 Tax=Plakobranchus ocellatus TaxID=259542 RepID=A0AAV3Z4X2_9GAST|nr:At-hook-containing transcription factor [Plakobranchus ocellatus]